VPQGDEFMRWDDPAWSETLFSSRNGLFPWSPLYAPMVLGVVLFARASVRLPLALLLGLLAQAEINGAAWDWWAGGSYGGRRFDSTYVVFAVGAAALISAGARAMQRGRAGRIRDRVIGVVAAAGFVVAILIAIANVELTADTSVISARINGGTVPARVWEQRVGGVRGWLAGQLADSATFPVRLAFALRHDLGADAYDRLVGVHHLGELFPPLVGDRDKRRDLVHVALPPPSTTGLAILGGNRAQMTSGLAKIRFGINRRDVITIRIPIELKHSGKAIARWNGQVAEGTGPLMLEGVADRGVNTLEIEAAPGTVLSAIELSVRP
ncbi:MAG: hypothetical protein H0V17_24480, partial [Deltaproteobacteria bacterium]|nr:hypothetical protein [Deltaproteobacteria bacterium]